jgi:hypothetical protein
MRANLRSAHGARRQEKRALIEASKLPAVRLGGARERRGARACAGSGSRARSRA